MNILKSNIFWDLVLVLPVIFFILFMVYSVYRENTDPNYILKTNSNNYDVIMLFETNGIKVYRFFDYDQHTYQYFTDTRGVIINEKLQ